jgi:hypothetical protein
MNYAYVRTVITLLEPCLDCVCNRPGQQRVRLRRPLQTFNFSGAKSARDGTACPFEIRQASLKFWLSVQARTRFPAVELQVVRCRQIPRGERRPHRALRRESEERPEPGLGALKADLAHHGLFLCVFIFHAFSGKEFHQFPCKRRQQL